MKYISVCSGIEAATVAWHPLGWSPVAFSEIEPFPSAILKHHYPDTPNLGDMTKFHEWPDYTINLLVGGCPCQAFSVAGLREGLNDPRGNLTLTFLGVAERYKPEWIVYENVPGILSDKTDAFGCLLAGLVELGYGVAWRFHDAQFAGLAQRRKRVFVVAHLGDWRRAAEVLFEPNCLRWDNPPSRETGQEVTGTLSARTEGGGGLGTDFDLAGGLQTGNGILARDVAHSLCAHMTKGGDPTTDNYVAFDTTQITSKTNRCQPKAGDPCHPLSASAHPPAIAFSCKDHGADSGEISPTLRSMGHSKSHANGGGQVAVAFHPTQDPIFSENGTTHALGCGSTGGQATVAVAEAHLSVRRLTPKECERLQGFPNHWTDIPYKGKPAKDGPRYKALGNSMAVPCMRWIGRRIQMVSDKCPALETEF